MTAGVITLLVCLALALALVLVGVLRAVRDGLRLKKRVAAYRELPILGLVAATEGRIASAERSIDGLQVLALRVDAVFAEFDAARLRLRDAVLAARNTVRFLPEILIENLPAIFATRARTREN